MCSPDFKHIEELTAENWLQTFSILIRILFV